MEGRVSRSEVGVTNEPGSDSSTIDQCSDEVERRHAEALVHPRTMGSGHLIRCVSVLSSSED